MRLRSKECIVFAYMSVLEIRVNVRVTLYVENSNYFSFANIVVTTKSLTLV